MSFCFSCKGWRLEEIERINSLHDGPERKAALIGLLDQEMYLIQCIERHRMNADKSNTEENIAKLLDKVKFFFLQFRKCLGISRLFIVSRLD